MTNEAKKLNKMITLKGMSWIRVYSACQALMAPTKFYRHTHKHCRSVILEELGYCPKGKPGTALAGDFNKGFRDGGNEAILDWLGVVHMCWGRAGGSVENAISDTDEALLVVRP